jgi:uncharacterized protein YjbI with pentapeptide repeats
MDPLESTKFLELLQDYRCASNVHRPFIKECLESLQLFIRENYVPLKRVGNSEPPSDKSHLDFSYSDTPKLVLDDSELRYTKFNNAKLQEASFNRVRGIRTKFNEACLIGADFSNAHLTCATFQDANLTSAKFYGAFLLGADFTGADLSNTSFALTILEDAVFSEANVDDADIRYCTGNGKDICSIFLDNWQVCFTRNTMAIGCQQHSIDTWQGFLDCEIQELSYYDALSWWKKWKRHIFKTIELTFGDV